MEMSVQRWVEDIQVRSIFQWEYRTFRKDEYPEDYKEILETFPKDRRKSRGGGILLSGNDHYASQAAAVKILEHFVLDDFVGIFLDGMELSEFGAEQAKARLNGLLDSFYDEGKCLCLILEGMEECTCRRELLIFLGEQLWESLLYGDQRIPLFLIFIDNRESEIPGLLRNRLQLYRTNVPSRSQRSNYLEKHAKYLAEYLSLELFVQLTEGADYIQIRDMIAMADRLIESRHGRMLTDGELTEFLAKQMPPLSQEKTTQQLVQKVKELADQLPQLLSGIAADQQAVPVAVAHVPAVTSGIQNEVAYLEDKRKETEEMSPKLLCADVLGERMLHRIS